MFFCYFWFFLLELGDLFGVVLVVKEGFGSMVWVSVVDDVLFLEDMVCVLCCGGERFYVIECLMM